MSHEFFLQLVIIIFAARVFGEIAGYFKIPVVIGELLAGIVLGPSLLNWIEPTETIHLLAEIGVVLLLFEVGLESDISKLVQNGLKATSTAVIGVILPFTLGYTASVYLFQLPLLPSLFVGCTLTATSIGITLRVLSELKRQNAKETQIVLGAAVIDDIIGIILLALLYEFSVSGSVELMNAFKILFFILVYLIVAPFAAALFAYIIKKYEEMSEIPGLLTTMTISLILLFAWLARLFGAPELLGGFAAGIALSKRFFLFLPRNSQISGEFSHRVEHSMKPIIYLFTPIFFVTIGLSLNLQAVAWNSPYIWLLSGVLLAAAIVGKIFSGLALIQESNFVKWAVGLAMVPRGEVGLIFANVGKSKNVFDADLYAALIVVITLTTFFTPIAMRWYYKRYDKKSVTT